MKTKNDLLQLIMTAILLDSDGKGKKFNISYSGHVNWVEIRYYKSGWKSGEIGECCDFVELDDEEKIQEAYWFIKNRI